MIVRYISTFALLAMTLVACNKDDGGSTATAKPAKPATPAPAPKPASGGKLPDVMTAEDALSRFASDKGSMMGKQVKIKGYYLNYTKQGDQLNVDVTPKPEASSKGALCIFPSSAKAALDKVTQKSQITVSGTVDGEFFGRPKLKDCKLE